MALLIDTATVPARERLDFWSEASWDPYHPLQIRSPSRAGFWAKMWGSELGPLGVFRIGAAPNTMIRTARAIAAGDPECVHVSVIVSGEMSAAQGGRSDVAHAGDVLSYETSHPVLLQADKPFESLVVRVPRALLGRHADDVVDRTAVALFGGRGVPRVAATYLRRLAQRLDRGEVPPDDVPATVARVLDLVRALYCDGADDPPHRSRAEILLNVESFIEANLGDPLLHPAEIAKASFISTRYLHKLFEAEGTSVCAWIRASRLERCRQDLLDPALADETILAIASRWGLPGPQHFCRLFRAAYGCSPSELRREGGGRERAAPLAAGGR